MQREITFDRVEDLLTHLSDRGITRVVFSVVNEKRPRQAEENLLLLEDTVRVDILAYQDSTIFKCVLAGADIDLLEKSFTSRGFEVTRRSRNII